MAKQRTYQTATKVQNTLEVFKALADENRLRIVMALVDGELCACQIVELLELAPSTISKHVSILRQARLVELRKEGRWMFYRLAGRDVPEIARRVMAPLRRTLAGDLQIEADRRKLQKILKLDREALCQIQRNR